MGKYGNLVQLFYLGALYRYGLPGSFDIRFLLPEPDQDVLIFDGVWLTKLQTPCGSQTKSSPAQLKMVLSLPRRGHQQVALVNYG